MLEAEMTELNETPKVLSIEQRSVDTVPLEDRHYSPFHVFTILYGSDLTFSIIIIGAFPVLFGLSWWSSALSIVLGSVLGGVVLAPMSLFGPRTGTNNAVSSGAHFGIVGRFIGTGLALFSALGFSAITIWTSGDAIVTGVARLVSARPTGLERGLGYAIVAIVVIAICVCGIHLVIWVQVKLMMPLMTVVLIVGVFAFAPRFHASYKGGVLAFSSYPATMVASILLIASVVISYGPFVGDWSRYIHPGLHTGRRTAAMTFLGATLGMGLPILWGAFAASTFATDSRAFVPALVAHAPGWYVVPLILIGLVAGVGQGVIGIYGTGLDTSSLIPRLSRVNATLLLSSVAVALVYLGAFVWNAINAVNAFLILLLVITTPWIVIMTVGYFHRRGYYLPRDLQVFTHGERGGRYWFSHGWNWRAAGAWLPASVVGIMFSAAPPLLTGPWHNAANGVDLSFVSSAVLAFLLYSLFLVINPEPNFVFGPEGPRMGHGRDEVQATPIIDNQSGSVTAAAETAR